MNYLDSVLKPLERFNQNCPSFQLFSDSIKSEKTKITYREGLNNFMRFNGISDYMDLKNADTDTIQGWLERWVIGQTKQGLKHFTIAGRLHGVELFLDMNKKVWYRKIVRKLMPSNDKVPGGEVSFSDDEVWKMVCACAKPRDKALIHFIACTGIRPTGFVDPILRMKHLEKIEDCYAVKVYDASKEVYYVFLTPEARVSLDAYISSRIRSGESIGNESPLFVNYTGKYEPKNDNVSVLTVRNLILRLLKSARIERTKEGFRYDKSIVYGFRKRFNGILKMNNFVNSNIAEKLMAHKNGLDGNYLKPTMKECFAEFKKAIPELTVDPTIKQRLEIQKKEEEITELKKKDNQLGKMQDKIDVVYSFLSPLLDEEEGFASFDGDEFKKMLSSLKK